MCMRSMLLQTQPADFKSAVIEFTFIGPAVNLISRIEGAVIDKDRASALLAETVAADAFLMFTDVDAVYENWGGADARPISDTTPEWLQAQAFAAGSMGPKVEAACTFVKASDGLTGIGQLKNALAILDGKAGTVVRPA